MCCFVCQEGRFYNIWEDIQLCPDPADWRQLANILGPCFILHAALRPEPAQVAQKLREFAMAKWKETYLAQHPDATDIPVRARISDADV